MELKNFNEALIAHLQGEKVLCRMKAQPNCRWDAFEKSFEGVWVSMARTFTADAYEFRLASHTITVNGVEVPAPESVAPEKGKHFYVPDIYSDAYAYGNQWNGYSDVHIGYFERGLVYLNKEDAIARAKAMLLTQE